MVNSNNAKSIFLAAIEMPPAERADFLNEAMAGDAALRERVEALLSAHDDPESFLEKPAVQFGAAVDLSRSELPLAERLGTVIGPYKLMEQIGEGGMGVVYMADQQTPVRRRVALKIIKPGMDTRQVIARFEAERQALALMDHSNIARVLDAGATDSGRPYFVMELVRGITDHRLLRPEQLTRSRAAGAVRASLPCRAACASEGDHPSRPQAVEYFGDTTRRPSRAQGD